MFITPQSVQAETSYRQERIKREFSRTRRERPEQAAKPEPRHARRALRPTTAA
ncbi:hypothetical protein [Kribbella sp. CA-293567]|uniref:hypothetical protein n=1 Tax=Kribbella sp. CA-293567 TaxID=3002436 RepID=UPI0022DD9D6F|nr:hypothetical protein [Kribbella sp. CA-293567]WBQ06273.1 hypothetical protein OX958_05620 [Kribbella sp. CA-293567]